MIRGAGQLLPLAQEPDARLPPHARERIPTTQISVRATARCEGKVHHRGTETTEKCTPAYAVGIRFLSLLTDIFLRLFSVTSVSPW